MQRHESYEYPVLGITGGACFVDDIDDAILGLTWIDGLHRQCSIHLDAARSLAAKGIDKDAFMLFIWLEWTCSGSRNGSCSRVSPLCGRCLSPHASVVVALLLLGWICLRGWHAV